jgi:hypothetical protein
MCYSVEIDCLADATDSAPVDLTEPQTFTRLCKWAQAHELEILDLRNGGSIMVIREGASCACSIAHPQGIATDLLDFARTLAQSAGLGAVRIAWIWSASETTTDQLMTFSEFEERNRAEQLAENTPYLLTLRP